MNRIAIWSLSASLLVPAFASAQQPLDLQMPAQAKPGQCYARVLVAATYRTETVPVIIRDAHESVQVSEPVFKTEVKRFQVSDAYKNYVVTPPTFRTEQQKIVVRPAHERLRASPAVIGTRPVTVVIREPRLVWRPGSKGSEVRRIDAATGEVFCLVEEPAKTAVIQREVQITPAQVSRESVRAIEETIERRILVTPPSVREEYVKADTRDIRVQTLVEPAREVRTKVEPRTGTMQRQIEVTPERYEWVPVVCVDTAEGKHSIQAVQRALAARKLYNGPIDGVIGSKTKQALAAFQQANGLPGQGNLTVATARALGL
ncbi:MAG: hypothetical protein CFE27_00650 [Alphaproteobacteria bacterium PA1]|nr:MAG: hypothetical protein CFE27_00650 [Alphaproteobacteria bacterium PA1]